MSSVDEMVIQGRTLDALRALSPPPLLPQAPPTNVARVVREKKTPSNAENDAETAERCSERGGVSSVMLCFSFEN